MKTLNMCFVLVLTWLVTGCAIVERPYGYSQRQEHGAVAAINQHGQAVHAVNSPSLIPSGSNCDRLDYGVVYSATNNRYDVQSSGGQKCRGGPTSRAGVPVQGGPGDASFEDCKAINFSILECQIYLQKRQGGGQ